MALMLVSVGIACFWRYVHKWRLDAMRWKISANVATTCGGRTSQSRRASCAAGHRLSDMQSHRHHRSDGIRQGS